MPDSLTAILIKANRSRIAGNYLDVLEICKNGVTIFGEHYALLTIMANCYFELAIRGVDPEEFYKKAIECLNLALQSTPIKSDIYALLGQYYSLGTSEYDIALIMYRKALSINPYCLQALTGISSLYNLPDSSVDISEAIGCLKIAVSIDANKPYLHYRLAQLYKTAGLLNESIEASNLAFTCAALPDLYMLDS